MTSFASPFHRTAVVRQHQEEVASELARLKAQADAREPKINLLWAWARTAKIRNGVGDDFEWSLDNPRRRGSKAT
jgi:hypothetical protein